MVAGWCATLRGGTETQRPGTPGRCFTRRLVHPILCPRSPPATPAGISLLRILLTLVLVVAASKSLILREWCG